MATNWTEITGNDLWKVISSLISNKADEGSEGETAEKGDLDETVTDTRKNALVHEAVAEFRAAILAGGKYPLSVTTGCLPPELVNQALNLAAYRLINSTPNLGMIILTEKGASSPFQTFYTEANKTLDALRAGRPTTPPTDPTGRDYLTAVADDNRAISGVRWGDQVADDWEYDQGSRLGVNGETIDVEEQRMTTN